MNRKSATAATSSDLAPVHSRGSELAHSMVVPRGSQRAPRSLSQHAAALRPARLPRETPPRGLALFCPFKSGINPHADAVQAESVEWACRLGLVESDAQRAKLRQSQIARLEALVFHAASREVLQVAANWTTLFCLLDDHVEREALGPLDMAAYLTRVLAGFRGLAAPLDDALSRAFFDLRCSLLALAGGAWVERFGVQLEALFCSYIWEEINREKGLRPSQQTYRKMRVDTIGLRPQFLFGELAADVELPSELRTRPELVALEEITSRAVGWANDIFTCDKELHDGEVHNLVLVLMDEERLSLAEARCRVAAAHDEEVRNFLSIEARLPDLGAANEAVRSYVLMLRCWIRGHLDWSQETGRYAPGPSFGAQELRAVKQRVASRRA
ncbi:MAG: Terpene synthase family, metal binding domain [Myxococcaceae bacterium]|nr:Terpene synthase family, metal binding domain [Myxococcaceae bacterium]